MTQNSSIGAWSFHSLVTSFPPTILPNIAYWNISNGTWEYQVQLSWLLNWTSTNVDATAETLYVLDGNALAQTATEAIRKRQFVEPTQQDTIVVTIGYPNLLPNSPYSPGRFYDYQMPVCENCTHRDTNFPPNADNFITFIDDVLRPWIRNVVFPQVKFNRDGLFGHSFGGNFVLYTLIVRPDLFDVFLSASPGLWWDGDYIFTQLGPLQSGNVPSGKTKPALQITYGGYEQTPQKRRRETPEAYKRRRTVLSSIMRMADLSNRLYNELKDSPSLRHIELQEYPFSYHAAVASAGLCDGIDYFLDW